MCHELAAWEGFQYRKYLQNALPRHLTRTFPRLSKQSPLGFQPISFLASPILKYFD
jgi:hypothetical protein